MSADEPRTFTNEEASLRTRALESLLLEKGVLADGAVDAIASAYEHDIGPLIGARVVARAWVDEQFKERLLADGGRAIKELGISGIEGDHLVVLENTSAVHNVVVCTLCSCYPWALLGLPPQWYKSYAYRSRLVLEPRVVLSELGLDIDEDVDLQVWDSSSDLRYMVLPERPPASDGLREEQLAGLITREAMIGVAKVTL
jgi:nitrile hydratase